MRRRAAARGGRGRCLPPPRGWVATTPDLLARRAVLARHAFLSDECSSRASSIAASRCCARRRPPRSRATSRARPSPWATASRCKQHSSKRRGRTRGLPPTDITRLPRDRVFWRQMQRCGHHTGYAVVWQRATLDREHSSGTFDVRFESNPYGFPGGLTKARGWGRERKPPWVARGAHHSATPRTPVCTNAVRRATQLEERTTPPLRRPLNARGPPRDDAGARLARPAPPPRRRRPAGLRRRAVEGAGRGRPRQR
jgi:hypothetical protein